MPSGPAVTSLRNFAPRTGMLATGAPVFRLNPRTASMSATQRVSPTMAMPLGAFRVTFPRPPATNLSESTDPSALIRLMKPLLSLVLGSPFTFDTNQRLRSGSQRADSGFCRSFTVPMWRASAGAEAGAAAVVSAAGASLRSPPQAAATSGAAARVNREEMGIRLRDTGRLQDGWRAGVGTIGAR